MDSSRSDVTVRHLLQPLAPILDDATVTELTINRPGEVWALSVGGWSRHEVSALERGHLQALATALIAFNGLADRPMVSVVLPDGERGQIIQPPACIDGMLSMTIRKHSLAAKSLDELADEGAFEGTQDVSFNLPTDEERDVLMKAEDVGRLSDQDDWLLRCKADGDWVTFMRFAVLDRRNIVIAGPTGSGKTTYARSLIDEIPSEERLVTIEDVHELELPNHPNKVHLLYGNGAGRVSATACLRECLRLSPDRILLSELRGDEAWDFVSSCNTGHPGSITTGHADGAVQTFSRFAQLIKQSEVGRRLDMDLIRHTLYTTIDVIVYMERRKVVEVFFDPIFKRSKLI